MAPTILIVLTMTFLNGCGKLSYEIPFDKDSSKSAFRLESQDARQCAPSFAENLCIPGEESSSENETEYGPDSYVAAMLFDLRNTNTMYNRNPYTRLYPASMTKVMTAIIAMENCSMDQVLTADENCVFTENDIQKVGLRPGDTMTLDQALHYLLIYSANDVANLIAVNVGGSIEGFADMMNEKARRLGATNTNFVNPSGLQDENHYTTAYDMYLMFDHALKYAKFIEIVGMKDYSSVYHNANGEDVTFECESTNRYLRGDYTAPSNVTVIGGKTGSTAAAGTNLVMLSKDASGNSYISVVMKSDNVDVLYSKTNSLLEMIQ